MNVILGEEEIRNFPVEIRDFLKSYLIERFEHGGSNTNISKGNIGIPKPFATDDSYNQDGFIEAPSFTKHPNRWLVIDERFDWFRFLEMAFTSPKGKNSNVFCGCNSFFKRKSHYDSWGGSVGGVWGEPPPPKYHCFLYPGFTFPLNTS